MKYRYISILKVGQIIKNKIENAGSLVANIM